MWSRITDGMGKVAERAFISPPLARRGGVQAREGVLRTGTACSRPPGGLETWASWDDYPSLPPLPPRRAAAGGAGVSPGSSNLPPLPWQGSGGPRGGGVSLVENL